MTTETKILIVDDDEMIRYILNRKLSKQGYFCEEAGNSEQAMSNLGSRPSELVLLDIEMPGKPGNVLLPDIQQHFPDTAVIMASGVTDTNVIARCIKDGAQDYVKKPFHLEDISLSIDRCLRKRQLEQQVKEYLKGDYEQVPAAREYFLKKVEELVNTLESNDSYTAGHSLGVTQISRSLGEKLGLSPQDSEDLYWGALLHDVGKIAVDPRILNKPGELTPEEYRHIMTHAMVGPRLVKPFVNDSVTRIISHHHDHFDGSGLNQLLKGEDIPFCARIVAVADAYNAMTSDRPYRPAMESESAAAELKRCSGSQFDPAVVDAMLGLLNR